MLNVCPVSILFLKVWQLFKKTVNTLFCLIVQSIILFNRTKNMRMRVHFYIRDSTFSLEFVALHLLHSAMKKLFRLSVNLNYQMCCCNSNCFKFSYPKSFCPFHLERIFSKFEQDKAIKDRDFHLYQFNNTYTIC